MDINHITRHLCLLILDESFKIMIVFKGFYFIGALSKNSLLLTELANFIVEYVRFLFLIASCLVRPCHDPHNRCWPEDVLS